MFHYPTFCDKDADRQQSDGLQKLLGEEFFPEEKFREHVLERLCVRLDKGRLVTRGEIARLLRRIKLPVPLFVTAAKIHVALDSTKFNQH